MSLIHPISSIHGMAHLSNTVSVPSQEKVKKDEELSPLSNLSALTQRELASMSQEAIANYLKTNSDKESAKKETTIKDVKLFSISETVRQLEGSNQVIEVRVQSQEDIERILKEMPHVQNLKIILVAPWDPTVIRDFDLSSLSYLKELTSLEVMRTRLAPGYREPFISSLPVSSSLKKLILNDVLKPAVFSDFFSQIASNKQLEELDISQSYLQNYIWKYYQENYKNGGELLKGFEDLPLKKFRLADLGQLGLRGHHLSSPSFFASLPKSIQELDVSQLDLASQRQVEDILALSHLKVLQLGYYYSFELPTKDLSTLFDELRFPLSELETLEIKHSYLKHLDFHHSAPHLKELKLTSLPCQQIDFRTLAFNANLERLDLGATESRLTPAQIELFNLISLPSLKHFRAIYAKGIDLGKIAPNLVSLDLSHSDILGGDLKNISSLQHLQHLNLSHASSLTGTSLSHICKLKQLKTVNLSGLDLRTEDFAQLKALASLEELNLYECYLGLAQMEQLASLSSLKRLDLRQMKNPNITLAEIETLQKKLPSTEILK